MTELERERERETERQRLKERHLTKGEERKIKELKVEMDTIK